jgi:SAM-dependent methyltransferase
LKVEFGTGNKPTPGYTHCDRIKHAPHIDMAFDLEVLPWPFEDESLDEILAIDVFEHLKPWKLDIPDWLNECHRVLVSGGVLEFRLPAYDHHYSFRDPSHYRVFHPESFHYFCPNAPGTLYQDFGIAYGYTKLWKFEWCKRDCNDLRFRLVKI